MNFSNEVCYPEARAFYAVQIFIETIHAETYSLLIDTYIRDPQERDHLFNALDTVPAVAAKASWATRYMDRDSAPFAVRLAAFAVVEGIFFSGAFASIFWLRKQGKLPGLGLANQVSSQQFSLTLGCVQNHNDTCLPLHKPTVHFARRGPALRVCGGAVPRPRREQA